MKQLARLLSILILLVQCGPAPKVKNKNSTQGLIAEHAMVVSAHPLASKIGRDIMKRGGNAVDAAVAVQFALAVVYPNAGNIGGGGFMVFRRNDGMATTLDFREKAPGKASRDMYLDDEGMVKPELSTMGHLAAGIPGSVDGMITAHEKYGTLPWKELVQPAIDLADNGFVVTDREAESLNNLVPKLKQANTVAPSQLLKEWHAGDTLVQEELGATLERIRDHRREGFYQGETARLILEEMDRGHGIFEQKDLDDYHSVWREPVKGHYRGYDVISMPPPSSGGIALMQLLESIEPFSLRAMGHNTPETIHLMVEAERRVYADRATYLGDPGYYPVPTKKLIDRSYVKERMASFDPKKATPSTDLGAGHIGVESEQTTHFSIVDSEGNAVAITTTLNGSYGSKVIVAGAGFLMNNEMDDFSAKPGYPNMYGLVGGEANAIEPGKRMLSSMTPTILEKDGKLFMVTGTPGGSTIITSVFQSIVNVVDFDMSMQDAVIAGRVHSQWLPDVIMYEKGAVTTADSLTLTEMGHKMYVRGSIGRVDAVKVLQDHRLEGGADPRGLDAAEGY